MAAQIHETGQLVRVKVVGLEITAAEPGDARRIREHQIALLALLPLQHDFGIQTIVVRFRIWIAIRPAS